MCHAHHIRHWVDGGPDLTRQPRPPLRPPPPHHPPHPLGSPARRRPETRVPATTQTRTTTPRLDQTPTTAGVTRPGAAYLSQDDELAVAAVALFGGGGREPAVADRPRRPFSSVTGDGGAGVTVAIATILHGRLRHGQRPESIARTGVDEHPIPSLTPVGRGRQLLNNQQVRRSISIGAATTEAEAGAQGKAEVDLWEVWRLPPVETHFQGIFGDGHQIRPPVAVQLEESRVPRPLSRDALELRHFAIGHASGPGRAVPVEAQRTGT